MSSVLWGCDDAAAWAVALEHFTLLTVLKTEKPKVEWPHLARSHLLVWREHSQLAQTTPLLEIPAQPRWTKATASRPPSSLGAYPGCPPSVLGVCEVSTLWRFPGGLNFSLCLAGDIQNTTLHGKQRARCRKPKQRWRRKNRREETCSLHWNSAMALQNPSVDGNMRVTLSNVLFLQARDFWPFFFFYFRLPCEGPYLS